MESLEKTKYIFTYGIDIIIFSSPMNSSIRRVGIYESIVVTLPTPLRNVPYNSLKKQMEACEPETETTFYVLAK
jgi:hypothetical protein